jgi:ribosomal protein S18 acetylase RimI-like enzyme
VLLDPAHDRGTFSSGSAPLDLYFRERVTQDIRRRVTACFVALSRDDRIAGYYTLAATSVLLGDLPEKFIKRLPRYPSVPAVRMGRLAVAESFKNQGLGSALLADALTRAVRSDIAAYSLVVDAKDEIAANFYRHHGFLELASEPLTLFLPLATVPVSASR